VLFLNCPAFPTTGFGRNANAVPSRRARETMWGWRIAAAPLPRRLRALAMVGRHVGVEHLGDAHIGDEIAEALALLNV
jgi:hypothetical protein